jgi:hypothetical protein
MWKRLTIGLAFFALVALLGGYVGGYFLLGEWRDCSWENQKPPLAIVRYYRFDYVARCFEPAAALESWVSGDSVHAVGPTIWQAGGESLDSLFND